MDATARRLEYETELIETTTKILSSNPYPDEKARIDGLLLTSTKESADRLSSLIASASWYGCDYDHYKCYDHVIKASNGNQLRITTLSDNDPMPHRKFAGSEFGVIVIHNTNYVDFQSKMYLRSRIRSRGLPLYMWSMYEGQLYPDNHYIARTVAPYCNDAESRNKYYQFIKNYKDKELENGKEN